MGKFLRIYRDFSGGLSEAANDNMKDDQLVEAKNAVPGDGYGIAKAPGVTVDIPKVPVSQPTLNRVTRLVEFKPIGGEPQLLAFISVPVDYEDIYRYDSATETWTRVAQNERPALDHFVTGGKLYWLNGVSLRVFDGTNVSNAALTPAGASATAAETAVWNKLIKAVAVEQRGQRWFFGTGDNEVIFSNVGDPTAFDPTNIININTKNGDSITALHEFNDGLLIFKKHSVHYLIGWDFAGGSDIRLQQLNVGSGTIFPDTVRTVDNGIIYLGIDGLYHLSVPAYTSVVASRNISEGRISRRLFERGQIVFATAAVWNNTYHLSIRQAVPYSEEDPDVLVIKDFEYRYLVNRDSFFGEFTMPIACYGVGLEGKAALYFGTDNGYILRFDRESRHYLDPITGQPVDIEVSVRTKGYDIAGSMAQDVRLEKLEIAAKQYKSDDSHMDILLKADYGEQAWNTDLTWNVDSNESLVYGEGQLGSGLWGWLDTVTRELVLKRRCKRLQFVFTQSSATQPLLVYGIAMLYRKKRVKGSRRGVDIS